MEVVLAVLKGVSGVVFSISILGILLALPVVILVGIIAVVTKEYKYLKAVLKIALYILGALISAILLQAVVIFLGGVLFG
jgi:hypothetical protein